MLLSRAECPNLGHRYCTGLSKSALQLVREIHHSASTHCTWRNADAIGSHLLDCVAIAVQRCTGMALRASVERETTRALGARAA